MLKDSRSLMKWVALFSKLKLLDFITFCGVDKVDYRKQWPLLKRCTVPTPWFLFQRILQQLHRGPNNHFSSLFKLLLLMAMIDRCCINFFLLDFKLLLPLSLLSSISSYILNSTQYSFRCYQENSPWSVCPGAVFNIINY
jgi:hypothetical protein